MTELCPNMVGPLNGVYYCRGKEYGYCDQRSGICFCNMGYSGLGCESCGPTHYQEGELCYPKREYAKHPHWLVMPGLHAT